MTTAAEWNAEIASVTADDGSSLYGEENADFTIGVDNPPCEFCSYWKPQRKTKFKDKDGVVWDGFVACISHPKNDFSCFSG